MNQKYIIIILEFSGLSQYSYKDFSQMNDKIVSKKGNLYMMKKTNEKQEQQIRELESSIEQSNYENKLLKGKRTN